MTAKARVLLLPLVVVGLLLVVAGFFYVRLGCSIDGRESPGDKHEWSILQSLEAAHREQTISDLEFLDHDYYHIACVPSSASGNRVWIMLDPHNPPYYKQMPHDDYSLSREQYDKIIATRQATSTVEEALLSHVR